MKKLTRAMAFTLAILLFSACFAFAETVTIVSPSVNSVVYADNILLSVKLTKPVTVRISVIEERTATEDDDTTLPVDVSKFTAETLETVLEDNEYVEQTVGEVAEFINDKEIGFYTKQIKLEPGLYKIQVETIEKSKKISDDGKETEEVKVLETISSFVAVKAKPNDAKTPLFSTASTGALSYVIKFLRSLFR